MKIAEHGPSLASLKELVDSVPALIHTARPDGSSISSTRARSSLWDCDWRISRVGNGRRRSTRTTCARSQRIGRFELASRGTIFLDEIGEAPLELQPKLLRVLQEREFERLGSSRTIHTDARLITATNVDLPGMVDKKRFRADLYYRLNVFRFASRRSGSGTRTSRCSPGTSRDPAPRVWAVRSSGYRRRRWTR